MLGASTLSAAAASNDPGFGLQWALTGAPSSIHAPEAWCAGSGDVLVADVDTGADFGHADLQGKLVAGAAFLNGDPLGQQSGSGQAAVQDDNGHGSMTTGIMSATTGNGVGIAGVAPSSRALIVKVLDSSGSGYPSDVAAGIRYAANYPGVRVINLSIGGDLPKLVNDTANPVPPAIHYAISKGVMVAAAAGNTYYRASDYSQLTKEALVVGGLNRDAGRASYSTEGNIYAPGGDGSADVNHWVLSTGNQNNYFMGKGTSLAAPQVAGTVALLMGNGMSAAEARQRVLATAVTRNGIPELDAAAAMGSSAGCAASRVPPPAATLNVGPAPKTAAKPKPPVKPAPAAGPGPSPSPSPEVSPSPSPIFGAPADTGPDVAPGTVLAAPPKPASSPSPLLVGGVALLGILLGYAACLGGLFLVKNMRGGAG